VYAFAYFTPTIISSLGYSVVQTQLHAVPPFAAALGLCLVMAYLSDRTDLRFPFVLFGNALLIIGLAILMTIHHNFSLQYAGICLVAMGAFGAGASIVCWYLMNLQGHKQRSIGAGWMISFGNTGGVLAPFTFLAKFKPYYTTGYTICMAIAVVGTVAALAYAALVLLEKRKGGTEENEKKAKVLSL
jgi:MFS family permease